MADAAAQHDWLRLELSEPDELFHPRASDVAQGRPPRAAGIERLLAELGASGARAGGVLIVVPADRDEAGLQAGIRRAVRSYCDTAIGRAESELRATQREGWRALGLGCVLLAAFLALSEIALRSALPLGLRDFFGNGLFVVAAWVGMWYPLDTLIYTGRPYRLERKLLRTLRGLEIVVQLGDEPARGEGGEALARRGAR